MKGRKITTIGLLAASLLVFLAGCSKEPEGTAPELFEAFLATYVDDNSFNSTKDYETKEVVYHQYLVYSASDLECDITRIEICNSPNFEAYYYWDVNVSDQYFWSAKLLKFSLDEEEDRRAFASTGILYVRLKDSKGHYSNIVTITGISAL